MSANVETPRMSPGYAFASSKRWPRDPATVVVGQAEIARANWVGIARIDGHPCHAFRCDRRDVGKSVRYYFQLAHELSGR